MAAFASAAGALVAATAGALVEIAAGALAAGAFVSAAIAVSEQRAIRPAVNAIKRRESAGAERLGAK